MKHTYVKENDILFSDLSIFYEKIAPIFSQAISDYHLYDSVNTPIKNPYPPEDFKHLLYLKSWIDTVQWHLEDEIRNPAIDPVEGLALKRRIDILNQDRTDKVELIDDFFLEKFEQVEKMADARINTESPAWAIDRSSILALKIYHMNIEVSRRKNFGDDQQQYIRKLAILNSQEQDMCLSINQLLVDIANGKRYMKVYRQMKMYNEISMNPVLYNGIKSKESI
jgi:Protein of unknown function (DUF4254)